MSDQDFFFDEDEKPAPKASSKKSQGSSKNSAPAPAPAAPGDAQGVSLTIAILIGVIGVLLGVVIGLFVGKSMATPAYTVDSLGTGAGAVTAPQLSPDQLNSGQLPPGHPNLPGASTTPTKTK